MTQNQIAYWNLQETKRSNLAKESETNRHNLSTEGETARHNVTSENIDLSQLNETVRSNKANEAIRQEQNRISSASLLETMKHNAALREKMGYDNILTQANVEKTKQDTELSTAKTAQTYVDLGFAPANMITKYSQAAQHLSTAAAVTAAGASATSTAGTGSATRPPINAPQTRVTRLSNPLSMLFVWDKLLEMNKITPSDSSNIVYHN